MIFAEDMDGDRDWYMDKKIFQQESELLIFAPRILVFNPRAGHNDR